MLWPVSIIAVLLFLEGASKFAITRIWVDVKEPYRNYYVSDPVKLILTWMDPFVAHPYFGYEYPDWHKDKAETLAAKTSGDYVVGIFGGSVAGIFADFLLKHPLYLDRLRQSLPEIGERRPLLVNFSAGGYKQPQQFFIASYFMDRIDLMINLDGFNDVASRNFYPLFPMEFPGLSLKLYGQESVWRLVGNTLKWCYKVLNKLPLVIPGLSRSHLYFLFWQVFHQKLASAIGLVEARYYSALVGRSLSDVEGVSIDIEHKVAIWKRYTTMQSRLAAAYHKNTIFFLQPNQYVKGSKPLSAEERQMAFNPSAADAVDEAMRQARNAIPELRKAGVQAYDLTEAFAGREETLYVDACCHFNDRGNEILTDVMISLLSAKPR
jgi:hypothetical protein